jgi:hypothetical protein
VGGEKLPTTPVTVSFAKHGLSAALQNLFTPDASFREFICTVEYSQPVWLRANPAKIVQQLLGGGDGKPDFFVGVGVVSDSRPVLSRQFYSLDWFVGLFCCDCA